MGGTTKAMSASWSTSRFDEEAAALCRMLSQQQRTTDDPPGVTKRQVSSFQLTDWHLQEHTNHSLGGDATFFLKHPATIASISPSVVTANQEQSHGEYPDFLDDDSNLFSDTEQVVSREEEELSKLSKGDCHGSCFSWQFSIVYHPTYQVPVLYFHVEDASTGEPASRDDVLRHLSPGDKSQEDSWEFVSQELHPCTNQPSYFLHPCRTAERMKVLLCDDEEEEEEEESGSHQRNLLWVWMSMILPAVGYAIPSKVYQSVRKELLLQDMAT